MFRFHFVRQTFPRTAATRLRRLLLVTDSLGNNMQPCAGRLWRFTEYCHEHISYLGFAGQPMPGESYRTAIWLVRTWRGGVWREGEKVQTCWLPMPSREWLVWFLKCFNMLILILPGFSSCCRQESSCRCCRYHTGLLGGNYRRWKLQSLKIKLLIHFSFCPVALQWLVCSTPCSP